MAIDTPTTTTAAVDVRGLTKRYGRRTVIDDIDVHVPTGTVTGLIGPNGAGKTTLMGMLLGLVSPSAGAGLVLGQPLSDPTTYVSRVGGLIEGPAFHAALSGRAALRHLALLGSHDQGRIDEVLELVGLSDRADDTVGSYSLGMKQRLGIAAALLPDPELVVLDEPANGVDPVGLRDLREIIRRIAAEGRSVLLSSHLLGELEQVCDHLLVLHRGAVVHSGPPEALPRSSRECVTCAPADPTDLPGLAAALGAAGLRARVRDHAVSILPGSWEISALAARVNRIAHDAGILLGRLSHDHTGLESRYLELIGEHPAPAAAEGADR